MEVRIATSYTYIGRDAPPEESFILEVEGQSPVDSPDRTAETYLELRAKLKNAIKEGTK